MQHRPASEDCDYETRQDAHDREYKQAWAGSSESFKKNARAIGLEAQVESEPGEALEWDGNRHDGSHIPDMAEALDSATDDLIEKHGGANAVVIRATVSDLKEMLRREVYRTHANALVKIAIFLIGGPDRNMKARVHAMLHSIPGFARQNGYTSMEESAVKCKCSREWMRRSRNELCDQLEIPVPETGRKSAEACAKYKLNAQRNHPRHQKFKAAPQNKPLTGSNGNGKHGVSLNGNTTHHIQCADPSKIEGVQCVGRE